MDREVIAAKIRKICYIAMDMAEDLGLFRIPEIFVYGCTAVSQAPQFLLWQANKFSSPKK